MSPPAIVIAAMDAKLDIIAICDHNAAGNAAAVREVAEGPGEGRVSVIAGMEITTVEEVHLVALFPNPATACAAAMEVQRGLPRYGAEAHRLGPQWLMNGDGDCIGEEDALLSAASGLSLDEAVALVHAHDGLAIAAHVDRPSFSVVSQLGFLPPTTPFDGLEISVAGRARGRVAEFTEAGLPLVTASDSHMLADVGCVRTLFELETPTFEELRLAFEGAGGRSCRIA